MHSLDVFPRLALTPQTSKTDSEINNQGGTRWTMSSNGLLLVFCGAAGFARYHRIAIQGAKGH